MIPLIKPAALLGVVFATGAVIDEKSLVPIGTLGAVATLVWWIGRKLQRIEDQLEDLGKKTNELQESTQKASIQLASLPCGIKGSSVCEQHANKLKMV